MAEFEHQTIEAGKNIHYINQLISHLELVISQYNYLLIEIVIGLDFIMKSQLYITV